MCYMLTIVPLSPNRPLCVLLDILDAFCQLFGMQVNLAPHKTCAVVFRPATMAVPPG